MTTPQEQILPEDVESENMNVDGDRLIARISQVKILAYMCFGMQGPDTQIRQLPENVELASYTLQEIIDHELHLERSRVLKEVREKVIGGDEKEGEYFSMDMGGYLDIEYDSTYEVREKKKRNKLRAQQRELLSALDKGEK